MEGKGVVALSILLSILVLSEIVMVANPVAAGNTSTAISTGAKYNITVSEKTLVLFDNELVNGNYSNPNDYSWTLTSAVYDPVNGFVYASNYYNNTVVVFDPKNYSIIGTIAVGEEPAWITINPENNYLYVVNQGSGTISVIDPYTNKVVNTIYVGGSPYMAVYDPNNGYLYVANQLSNGTFVVQLVDNQGVVKSIPVPPSSVTYPVNSMVYDPVSHYVVVSSIAGMYAISGDEVVANNTNQDFGNTYIGNVYALAINPANGDIYGVTDRAVAVYNPYNLNITGAVLTQIPGPIYAAAYANGTVYVLAGSLSYKVWAVNVAENTSKLLFYAPEIGISPSASNYGIVYANGELVLALTTPTPFYVVNPQNGEGLGVGVNVEDPAVLYDPVTGYVYVADEYSNALYVVDPSTGKVVNVIPSILEPSALAYNPENGYLYVASYNNNTVAEVDPYNGQVIWTTVAGSEPNAIIYNTYNNLLYVEYYGTSTVAVINASTGKILGEAQVGSDPVSLTFDPSTGLVYVANQGSDSITVINGTQVVNTINLDLGPTALAFVNGSLYIGGVNENYAPCVAVYKDGKIVANISLSMRPTDIQYYDGLVYVTEYSSNILYTPPGYLAVINGTRVLTDVEVGECPTSITVTPNGTVYVANEDQGTISEINVSFKPIATTTTMTSTTVTTSTATATTTSTTTTSTTSATTTAATATTPTTTTKATAITSPTGVPSPSATPTSTSGLPISPDLLIVIVVVVIVIIAAVVFLLKR